MNTIYVEDITCANCAKSITFALEKLALSNIYIDISSGEVSFNNPKNIDSYKIQKAIGQAGFKIKPSVPSRAFLSLKGMFYISLLLTIPLNLHMFINLPFLSLPKIQFLLAFPVFIIGCFHFGKSAFYSIRSKHPNMDVLIFTGALSAFGYSLIVWLVSHDTHYLFFETSSSIITLVLLGNLIEKNSLKKVHKTIDELTKLQTQEATILDPITKKTHIVNTKSLKKNDCFIVNSGDFIPTDGIITQGEAYIDESSITGESIPTKKNISDEVFAGCKIINGSVNVKVTFSSNKNSLSKIINLIKQAQTKKPDIQNLGDIVSSWFVPIVISIAIVTFILAYFGFELSMYHAMLRSISVLVISCPCAMGLATPTAIMVGLKMAQRSGILIKDGKALEQFSKVNTIMFDKTGTLTNGHFKISTITPAEGTTRQSLIDTIYHLEKHSSHPIAKALVSNLESEVSNLDSTHWQSIKEISGKGVSAYDTHGNVFSLIKSNMPEHDIVIEKNGRFIGGICIKDFLKPGAKLLISKLNQLGIRTIILSGDNKKKVTEVAKELGVTKAYYGKTPQEKHDIISQFTQQDTTVMVGDGINDAPSLAKASIGVSFAKASQIAIESADIILLNKDITALSTALEVSKLTLKTIKQNLFWALGYNVIAIPLVILTGISPTIAVATMAFSDLIVIGNSLRINYFKR